MNFRQVSAFLYRSYSIHTHFIPTFSFVNVNYSRTFLSTINNKQSTSPQINSPQKPVTSTVPGALSRQQYLEFQARSNAIIATRWRRQLALWVVGNFGLLASMFIIFLHYILNICISLIIEVSLIL